MNIVKFNNRSYVIVTDVIKDAPLYSRGSKSAGELIRKKKIDKTKHCLYARRYDNDWKLSNGKSRKYDKLFIRMKFIKQHVQEIGGGDIVVDGFEKAPDIIELDDHEKFQDNEGDILEIETRGERNEDNIYFLVKDVCAAFGMDNLRRILQDKKGAYYEGIDYKNFIFNNVRNSYNKKNKRNQTKDIFFDV
jgi:hypothetical protein